MWCEGSTKMPLLDQRFERPPNPKEIRVVNWKRSSPGCMNWELIPFFLRNSSHKIPDPIRRQCSGESIFRLRPVLVRICFSRFLVRVPPNGWLGTPPKRPLLKRWKCRFLDSQVFTPWTFNQCSTRIYLIWRPGLNAKNYVLVRDNAFKFYVHLPIIHWYNFVSPLFRIWRIYKNDILLQSIPRTKDLGCEYIHPAENLTVGTAGT